MTELIDRLERMDKPLLTTADIAPILGCNPYAINLQAHRDPRMLGFPVIVTGRRVRIPREAFLAFLRGGDRL